MDVDCTGHLSGIGGGIFLPQGLVHRQRGQVVRRRQHHQAEGPGGGGGSVMVRFPDEPPENISEGPHGKRGPDGIFNNKKTSPKPPNHLSAPIPGAPTPSNLTRYRIRTSWILTPEDQARLMLWAKADDRRTNRPVL